MLARLKRVCTLRPLSMPTLQPVRTSCITKHTLDPHPALCVRSSRGLAFWSKKEKTEERGILLYYEPVNRQAERIFPACIWFSLPCMALFIPLKYVDNVMLYGSTWDLPEFGMKAGLGIMLWVQLYVTMSNNKLKRLYELKYLPKTQQITFQTLDIWGGVGKLHGPFDPSLLYIDRDVKSTEKGGKVYLKQKSSGEWSPGLVTRFRQVNLVINTTGLVDPIRFAQVFPKSEAYLALEKEEQDEASGHSTQSTLDSNVDNTSTKSTKKKRGIEVTWHEPKTVNDPSRIKGKKIKYKNET